MAAKNLQGAKPAERPPSCTSLITAIAAVGMECRGAICSVKHAAHAGIARSKKLQGGCLVLRGLRAINVQVAPQQSDTDYLPPSWHHPRIGKERRSGRKGPTRGRNTPWSTRGGSPPCSSWVSEWLPWPVAPKLDCLTAC